MLLYQARAATLWSRHISNDEAEVAVAVHVLFIAIIHAVNGCFVLVCAGVGHTVSAATIPRVEVEVRTSVPLWFDSLSSHCFHNRKKACKYSWWCLGFCWLLWHTWSNASGVCLWPCTPRQLCLSRLSFPLILDDCLEIVPENVYACAQVFMAVQHGQEFKNDERPSIQVTTSLAL